MGDCRAARVGVMRTLEAAAEVDLRQVVGLVGRVISVYFRRPSPDESTAGRRHGVAARLATQGVGAAGLRAVDEALCDVQPGRGVVALFGMETDESVEAGESRSPALIPVDMPDAAVPDLAICAVLPHLVPFLAWRQENDGLGAEQAATRAILEDFAHHLTPDGLAVQGAPAVLHALSRRRVRTLLVAERADDERVVWFGPGDAELSGHRGELAPACGGGNGNRDGDGDVSQAGQPRRGRLVDAAVRAAILTGTGVRILRPQTAGAPEQGLGALCRFH